MEVGTVLSIIQTLLSVLQTEDLKKALSIFGYKSQLDGLKQTVGRINAVLRDAEAKQQLLAQDQNFIDRLKDAAFEADDLFDEVLTLAAQKKLIKTDGNISQKLANLLSRSKNPFTMSRKIKRIQKKLDAIAYDNQFSFKIDPQPIKERNLRETCSYVEEAEIMGREHDLEKIVGMLLASSDDQTTNNNVSVFSIVGMGGLGKTALAQLVYNDPRVREAFPLKMWTCVSDEGQDEINVKDILGNILGRNQDGFTLEHVQEQFRAQLEGQKFLLVLDDLWTEDAHQWGKLVKYLNGNTRGSWILVTTRSKNTAAAITDGQIHELSGLSEENSWSLFEKTAFNSKESHPLDEDLVSIGKQIVDRCGGVPLAIKVAGSLLYGQDKSKWLLVQQNGLANTGEGEKHIMSILKLSYYHLEPPLRSCFSYCALFPKDWRIHKDMLIRLWMAQGYIIPPTGQSIEDAGEDYFSILVKRCFFQDIENNEDNGEIESCKIHDLMHDIAQKVSGKDIYVWDTNIGTVDKDVRHLSISNWSQFEKCFPLDNTHIRSLLLVNLRFSNGHCELLVDDLVKSFKRLRFLDLSEKNIKCLPDSIGELVHLRYIDLSLNRSLEALPNSITKLCNLQTLILCKCRYLEELPKDLSRLVKLRVLDIEWCQELRCMPRGMGKMTCLHTMKGRYMVGGEGRPRCKSWKQWFDMLEDHKPPINLKELELRILWPEKNLKNDVKEGSLRKGLFLKCLEHLEYLCLIFEGEKDSGQMEGMEKKIMEDVQPYSNLKGLALLSYNGVKFPSWFLPNLVKLYLLYCEELKYLPWLENSCHLTHLCLCGLKELEYMIIEEESRELARTSSSADKVPFYPSLEYLALIDLPKWKGWRRGGVALEESNNNNNNSWDRQLIMHLCLPQLKKLEISHCREFTNTLLCPMLETLQLKEFNEGMQIEWTNTSAAKSSEEAANQNPAATTHHHVSNLTELRVSKGAWLDSIPIESFYSLQELRIDGDKEMVELPNNWDVRESESDAKLDAHTHLSQES